MSPPLPPDQHQPDRLLNLVGRLVHRALAAEGAALAGLAIDPFGVVHLAVTSTGAPPVRVRWVREEAGGVAVPTFGGVLVAETDADVEPGVPGAWLDAISQVLSGLAPDVFGMLRFGMPVPEPFPFDGRATDRMFGVYLSADRTQWRGFACRTIHQEHAPAAAEPASVEVHFASPAAEVTLRLLPAEGLAAGDRTRIGPFLVEVQREGLVEGLGPEVYGLFLLSRRVHPGARCLVPEAPNARDDGAPTGRGRPRPCDWGASSGWYRFLHMPAVEQRCENHRVNLGRGVAVIFGERECQTAELLSCGPRFGRLGHPPKPWMPTMYNDVAMMGALVSEEDVIRGPGDLFARLRRRAEAVRDGGVAVYQESCISAMLGEDVHLMATESGNAPAAVEAGDNLEAFGRDFLETLFRRAPSRGPGEGDARAGVVLAGFAPGAGRDELVGLLRAGGVEVRGSLLPDVDMDRLDDLRQARLWVLYPASHRQASYALLTELLGTTTLSPPAPFGIDGTRRWLRAVLDAAAPGADVDAILALRAAREARYERLREEARPLAATFVVSASDADLLLEPARTIGVPLVAMLREMGASLEVLYRVEPAPGRNEPCLRRLRKAFGDGAIRTFDTPAALDDLLAGSAARLVCSDVNCDDRIHRHGKASFGVRDFEMGIGGAVATLERLSHRARIPFFARYAHLYGAGETS